MEVLENVLIELAVMGVLFLVAAFWLAKSGGIFGTTD